MTIEESTKILTVLTAAYPGAYRNISPTDASAVCAVWAAQFSDVPVDIVFLALQKVIAVCKYPPTIAEIKEKIRSVHWDAFEVVCKNGIGCKKSAAEIAEYQRIYKATEKYRYEKTEPSLQDIVQPQETEHSYDLDEVRKLKNRI